MARHELQFLLPEPAVNVGAMFGGAGVIYTAAAMLVLFLLWLRPPMPYLTTLVHEEPIDFRGIVFENVAGPTGGGGGGGNRTSAPELRKTEPTPAIKPPEPPSPTAPVEQLQPPPDPTPPAAEVPAVATANPLAMVAPGPPVLGSSLGPGTNGAGGNGKDGVGPGDSRGLGPGGGGPGVDDGPGGGGVDVQVVPIFTPKPNYTSEGMLRKIQGRVVLSCLVSATGKVEDCRITQSLDSNQWGLDDQALKAAGKFLFRPAMRKGKPVPVRVNIIIDFTMR